jgi:hypothetical protein
VSLQVIPRFADAEMDDCIVARSAQRVEKGERVEQTAAWKPTPPEEGKSADTLDYPDHGTDVQR